MRQITIPSSLKISNSNTELIEHLDSILEGEAIKEITICYSNTSNKLLAIDIVAHLKTKGIDPCIQALESRSYSIQEINMVTQKCQKKSLVIGIGGGRVLDIAKYAASQSSKLFISIPTLISHDGICSPVAVIDGQSIGAVMPTAILVPLHIVQKSPLRYIHAGIGDLISNLSAIADWELAAKHKKEKIDDFAILLSRKAALSTLQAISNINCSGKNPEIVLRDENFLRSLIESLNLAGIAMSIAGSSRPCSGAEHMISHAIDQIYGHDKKALHGIQVGIATLYLDQYREQSPYDLKSIFESIGFPTSFDQIGISSSDIGKILEIAPQTRAGRFTILDFIPSYKA